MVRHGARPRRFPLVLGCMIPFLPALQMTAVRKEGWDLISCAFSSWLFHLWLFCFPSPWDAENRLSYSWKTRSAKATTCVFLEKEVFQISTLTQNSQVLCACNANMGTSSHFARFIDLNSFHEFKKQFPFYYTQSSTFVSSAEMKGKWLSILPEDQTYITGGLGNRRHTLASGRIYGQLLLWQSSPSWPLAVLSKAAFYNSV